MASCYELHDLDYYEDGFVGCVGGYGDVEKVSCRGSNAFRKRDFELDSRKHVIWRSFKLFQREVVLY